MEGLAGKWYNRESDVALFSRVFSSIIPFSVHCFLHLCYTPHRVFSLNKGNYIFIEGRERQKGRLVTDEKLVRRETYRVTKVTA